MPSSFSVLACAIMASLFWSFVGLSISSLIMPRRLAFWAAATLGWAVHSVLALMLFETVAMTRQSVSVLFLATACAAAYRLLAKRVESFSRFSIEDVKSASLVAAAALLALSALPAVLPHLDGDNVALATPIFDHSKVAFIDEIVRSGVPAANPIFGQQGSTKGLPYYYLWHFSAAELALIGGFSGWEADAGMTLFTAFSSLALMIGIARWLAQSPMAGWGVLAFAFTASIRPLLYPLQDRYHTYEWTGWPSGFGAWLFQLTWAPQHIASAGCVLMGSLVLSRLPRTGLLQALLLASIAAAAFESSAWVGGVTFLLIAAAVGFRTLVVCERKQRGRFAALTLLAAVISAAMVSPFLLEQARAVSARGSGFPITVLPFEVLGDAISESYRQALEVPAFWLVYLSIELQAIYLVGLPMLARLASDRSLSAERRDAVWTIICVVAVSLLVAWLLHSNLAENNDLSWRGVLPAVMALIASAAAGLTRYARRMSYLQIISCAAILGLGLISGAQLIYGNVEVAFRPTGRVFARSVEMWEAVRRSSAPYERIANNPMFAAEMTAWPINISWALLANRRSCYAGSEFALPFISLPRRRLAEIDALFFRIFGGRPDAGDVAIMASTFDCAMVVITPMDGAWQQDPFASGDVYRLVDQTDAWRIYRRANQSG